MDTWDMLTKNRHQNSFFHACAERYSCWIKFAHHHRHLFIRTN